MTEAAGCPAAPDAGADDPGTGTRCGPPWTYLPGEGWTYSVKDTWHLRIRPRLDGGPGVMLDTYSYGTGLWSAPVPPGVFDELAAALRLHSAAPAGPAAVS